MRPPRLHRLRGHHLRSPCRAPAFAQYGGGGPAAAVGGGRRPAAGRRRQGQEAQRGVGHRRKNLSLPQLRNAGPCPYVKVLYDAARYVEFKDDSERLDAASATPARSRTCTSACEYKADRADPGAGAACCSSFGRGPQARGLAQDLPLLGRGHRPQPRACSTSSTSTCRSTFPPAQDRVTMTDDIDGIIIPRADAEGQRRQLRGAGRLRRDAGDGRRSTATASASASTPASPAQASGPGADDRSEDAALARRSGPPSPRRASRRASGG